jgi:antitoxin component YwqK of YwqJK toxin-antitoxin module
MIKSNIEKNEIVQKRVYKVWDEKGEQKRCLIAQKFKDGPFFHVKKYHWQNGALKKEFHKTKKGKTGEYISYFFNGKIETKETFIDGEAKGPCILAESNGKKRECVELKNGQCKELDYDKKGVLKKVTRYEGEISEKVSTLQGKCKKWDHDGKLKWKRLYHNNGEIYIFRDGKIAGVKSKRVKCKKSPRKYPKRAPAKKGNTLRDVQVRMLEKYKKGNMKEESEESEKNCSEEEDQMIMEEMITEEDEND